MEQDLVLIGAVAGALASVIQLALTRFGFLRGYQTLIALGASLTAGLAITFLAGDTNEADDFFASVGAALGASQALYALLLAKLPPAG